MTKYRKKLIEVALPLEAINKESAREKSIRHGHPSTLHLWWARRPLAACRAVLFSSLVNDPEDDPMYGIDKEIAYTERVKLFDLIEELVMWDNSNNPRVINAARLEIARSIAANKVTDKELKDNTPLVANAPKLTDQQSKCLPDPPSVAAKLLADIQRAKGNEASEVARELSYRLYSTCERKSWAGEARSYNGLVVSWPEVSRLARQLKKTGPRATQQE